MVASISSSGVEAPAVTPMRFASPSHSGRSSAACQQEINRRRGGAAVNDTRIAEGLAIMPALGVRRERERADDVGGALSRGHREFSVFDIR